MKILSVVLTVGLFVLAACFLMTAHRNYYSMNSPFIPKQLVVAMTRPYRLYSAGYFIFALISLFLSIKKRYLTNIIMAGCLLLFYLLTIMFIGYQWLA